MQFEIETYIEDKTNKPMCFISSSEYTATEAEYRAENIEQISRAVALFLEDYYPDCIPKKGD